MIYAKTAIGLAAMQDRSAGLTPRQRSAFIMFDGKRSSSQILKMTAGEGCVQSGLEHLVSVGLLAVSGPPGCYSSLGTCSRNDYCSGVISVFSESQWNADAER